MSVTTVQHHVLPCKLQPHECQVGSKCKHATTHLTWPPAGSASSDTELATQQYNNTCSHTSDAQHWLVPNACQAKNRNHAAQAFRGSQAHCHSSLQATSCEPSWAPNTATPQHCFATCVYTRDTPLYRKQHLLPSTLKVGLLPRRKQHSGAAMATSLAAVCPGKV